MVLDIIPENTNSNYVIKKDDIYIITTELCTFILSSLKIKGKYMPKKSRYNHAISINLF
ncbi:MAG: hypothetical protein HRT66_09620 [Flavobacteriaceae bacterium]|nr:hypothetical protein [Flavobacteriaceae bacterium]